MQRCIGKGILKLTNISTSWSSLSPSGSTTERVRGILNSHWICLGNAFLVEFPEIERNDTIVWVTNPFFNQMAFISKSNGFVFNKLKEDINYQLINHRMTKGSFDDASLCDIFANNLGVVQRIEWHCHIKLPIVYFLCEQMPMKMKSQNGTDVESHR